MNSLVLGARTWAQQMIREGAAFRRVLRELESHATWTDAERRAAQNAALARLFDACHAVPFYQARLDNWFASRSGGNVDPLELLARVPLLDKQTVRAHNADFRAGGLRGRLARSGYTSGTTGTPLRCYRDTASITFENAALWRVFRWGGLELRDKRVMLRGDLVVPTAQREPPYWKLASSRILAMSSYHLTPSTIPLYVDAMRRFGPAAIQAYPSSVALVAQWMVQHGETLPLKCVITSSETLLDAQREHIERAFACPVIDYYGNAERTAMLARCERGAYHALTDYAVTEFVDQGDGTAEIVGTPLFNLTMPLLRYRSGDGVALPAPTERCPCGRTFPVTHRPEGRRDVYVLTPDGRRIGRLDHVFKGLTAIREAQIVQPALDRLIIRLVPDADFGPDHEAALIAHTKERVGPDLSITVERVDALPRTSRGKLQAIVSELDDPGVTGAV